MTADRAPAGSPIAPVRGSGRGPSAAIALLLVAAAVAGAIVVAVVSAPLPEPAPQPGPSALAVASPSASVPGTAPASPSAAPSARSPAPVATTIVVLRGVADPGTALGRLAGCSPLLRVAGLAIPAIKGSDVDATAVDAGRETGWLFVPPGIQALTRVWLGDDVVELARAAGRPVVAVGTNGDVWLGGPAGAAHWRPIPTPAGRTAWVLTADEVTSNGHCGPWPVPTSLGRQRSITCDALPVPTCLRLAARVGAETPGVPYPGGDMALTGAPCPPALLACGDAPVTAVSVPSGWAGTIGGVQAAMAQGPSDAFRLLAPGEAPDYALEAIFRPSLPLPTHGSGPARACATTLAGDLHAAPWDPRVFWVGATAVVWPAGSSAQFGDRPALSVPRTDGSYRFIERAPVRLLGSLDSRTHAFVACTVGALSAVSGTSVNQ